jgi:hypothetical protein
MYADAPHAIEPFAPGTLHARLDALYRYWLALPRPAGPLPTRAAFDPFAVREAIGSIWMLDIQREPFRLRYRLQGTRIVDAVGRDETGRWLDELVVADRSRPVDAARLRESALDGLATHARTRPLLAAGSGWSAVESLMLPLAADGRTPDILLCASVYFGADGSAV